MMDYTAAEERKYLGEDDDEGLGFFTADRPKSRLRQQQPGPAPEGYRGAVARVEQKKRVQYQEEEEVEVERPSSPPYRKNNKGGVVRSKFFNDEDDEGEEEEEEERRPKSRLAPMQQQKKKQQTRKMIVDEDEEEEAERRPRYAAPSSAPANEHVDKTLEKLYKGMEFTIPIRRGQTGVSVIPYHIQQAADTILHSGERSVKQQARQQLQLLIDHPDEYTVIDPQVTLSKTVDTGICRVYLKEIVPVSHLLMARALKVQYQVYVTKKVYFPAEDFSEVSVKPFHGKGVDHAQPFGLSAALETRLDEEESDFLDQVNAYMYAQGPLSTREACDAEFIDTHVDAIKAIRTGKLVPIKRLEKVERKLMAEQKKPRKNEEEEG